MRQRACDGSRSRTAGTIGHQVFHELVSRGFQGPVYPINQEADFVASVRAWRSVLDVPGELDLAIICVPADEVLRVAEECAFKRVQGLVVLSSISDSDETVLMYSPAELEELIGMGQFRKLYPTSIKIKDK